MTDESNEFDELLTRIRRLVAHVNVTRMESGLLPHYLAVDDSTPPQPYSARESNSTHIVLDRNKLCRMLVRGSVGLIAYGFLAIAVSICFDLESPLSKFCNFVPIALGVAGILLHDQLVFKPKPPPVNIFIVKMDNMERQ